MTNGQDTATDDASQDTGQDTAASDPNLVNTPKNEGYGRNVQTSLRKTSPMKSVTVQQLTIAEQSMLAMQQFGILVGVALLVGILFALNIGLELLFDAICEKCEDMFGAKKIHKVENPAALVGTFKRYK
jgi:hypothetical protein